MPFPTSRSSTSCFPSRCAATIVAAILVASTAATPLAAAPELAPSDRHFLAGVRAASASDLTTARKYLAGGRAEYPLLGSYASYVLAGCEAAKGDAGRALALYGAVEPGEITPELLARAMIARGELLARAGRRGEAEAAWELVAARPTGYEALPDSAVIAALEHLARLAETRGEWRELQRHLARIWQFDPTTAAARDARRRSGSIAQRHLAAAAVESAAERFGQAIRLADAGHWKDAEAVFHGVAPLLRGRDHAELEWRLGQAAAAAHQARAAREHYDRAAEEARAAATREPWSREVTGEALLGILELEIAAGRRDAMLAAWRGLRAAAPQATAFERGTFRLGAALRNDDDPAAIETLYRAWLGDNETSEARGRILWELSRFLLGAGRGREARPFVEALAREPDLDYRASGLYWSSRLAGEGGDAAAAERFGRELESALPFSYHAYRLRSRAGRTPPSDLVAVGRREPVRAGELPAALWSAAEAAASATVRRAAAFRRMGLYEWCCLELAHTAAGEASSRALTGALEVAARAEWGRLPEAVRLAHSRFKAELLGGASALPAEVWDAAYPSAFEDVRGRVAASNGLDPLLLAALAHRESAFDPAARSPAGAIGLVQLMPATARTLLRREHRAYRDGMLRDPEENLRLGARYLASLLARWPGRLDVALAAYNAGPSRAEAWRRLPAGDDPDLFVETIPFRETRVYVKGVMRTYWEYRRLYGSG